MPLVGCTLKEQETRFLWKLVKKITLPGITSSKNVYVHYLLTALPVKFHLPTAIGWLIYRETVTFLCITSFLLWVIMSYCCELRIG